MTSDSKTAPNRKLRWLWTSLVLYLMIMFVALHYASQAPYQVLALGGILNIVILSTFILAIRRVYLRTRVQTDLGRETSETISRSSLRSDRLRLLCLWTGEGIAILTCVSTLVHAREVSYQAVIGILILYAAIATAFILEIRRVSKRLRQ